MDWFLYDKGLRHETINSIILQMSQKRDSSNKQ